MKKLFVVVLVLVAAAAVLGYKQGWLSFTKDGKVDVQVDVEKFKKDKEDFSKTFGEKVKSAKDKLANLSKESDSLSGDDKTHAQKELSELKEKHEKLVSQIKRLDDAGADKFEDIKNDLSKALEDVDSKIDELAKKVKKSKT